MNMRREGGDEDCISYISLKLLGVTKIRWPVQISYILLQNKHLWGLKVNKMFYLNVVNVKV